LTFLLFCFWQHYKTNKTRKSKILAKILFTLSFFLKTVLNDLQGNKKGRDNLPYQVSEKTAQNPIKTLAKW
jgi:hypothetical protein